ncbi:SDR family NAD(P)-dependent oxidoreductase [Chelatococcus asaccharovorans]|uniref:NAD(P)-dependent dehydrogenase (Short-subunit alcohol dehydrogenase family) n=1 Tax=Chelatococcus asaccharovorans TaxID=28210 RepID=A0A2V3ULE2_9HYPH|nr:SDR family NAD(P)-dependent oxidoreductase [Chelatococcus asaccharovorans]MBS7706223.1 SDR family NAD(P)-dependent oxidoreductase [Chelatococcus asaccharovorans]PXW65144.1 NAD(P)-dependent dehydrogenase (short-subunit alcohol dehydrogenase family) [Chelatococcus asaccharovorans]CAH1660434.1 NAD(P)-dependent dehydrogenase (Short-subunit alcohol dehydrogenase family) [Chelatococcus asaccharovorans]CAH1683805.1 NAD(P)-dependent dehydrogenase (Short-subunit alcohol dehydrogenase family) [Chelato
MDVKDRVCVVTGGSSGLGQGTIEALLAGGARVANLDLREPHRAPDDERELFLAVDVSDEQAVATAIAAVVARFGAVHVCVNCAGIVKGAPVVGDDGIFPMALFRRTIDVNLTGTFQVLAHCARHMARNAPGPDGERGVIVNTASIAAVDASSSAAYAASKGGVVSLTLTVARDLARLGIRINAICPGFMDTEMFGGLPADWTAALVAKTVFPKRLGHADEFGQLVCHLIENRFMNASIIRFDAGARV